MALAPHDVHTRAQQLAEENAHLAARVHELEHLLQLERSHRGAAPSSGR
jgi:hypothetical protein